jgi:nitroimidazol reductase NimA-like FMN-containing flavoprotein (pyridoxamine 5'-phosphate oxidase superfamily)
MMSISTVRPDGWPQTTIVGYANDGWTLYFLIFRSSQKFSNIAKDNRVSIAVSSEPHSVGEIKAVYAGAHASVVADEDERKLAWQLLMERHPNLADFGPPDDSEEALMRADCKYVSVLDYSKGIGHTEALTVGADGAAA